VSALAAFPSRLEEVSPQWLTRQLTHDEDADQHKVLSFHAELIGEGTGMLSDLYRLGLSYSEAAEGFPASLIAKFTTTNPVNRVLGMESEIYLREVSFYRTLAPLALVPVPASYANEYNPDTGESVLLLEDMTGYVDGDQVAGCSARRAVEILDGVVPLHIHNWGRSDRDELSWLWRVGDTKQIAAIGGALEAVWAPCVEKFGYAMTPEVKRSGERYVAAFPAVSRLVAQFPQTVVHGDLRLDNVMYGTTPKHHPIAVIDWQAVLASSATQDLAYLLTQNVTPDERHDHEAELIAHYHRRLLEGGIEGYSLDDCWESYRVSALYTLSFAIFTCGGVVSPNERGRRQQEAMMRRAAQAVTEMGTLSMLTSL
jgi:Ecdysteroid kinase-like family